MPGGYDLTSMVQSNVVGNRVVQLYDEQLDELAGLIDSNNNFIVGDGSKWVAESGSTARDSLELGTGHTPQFTGIELGHANDTTITRPSGGDLNIQGNIIYRAGGTDVAVADGGTGLSSLALTGGVAATRIMVTNGSVMGFRNAVDVCFLKGTKITLPDYSQKNIEDLTLADDVLTYNIEGISNIKDKNVLKNVQLDSMVGKFSTSGIRNIWINPTDSYLFINDKLKVTKNHIVHFKRDNQYYFRFAEHLTIGDELMNDKEVYESVESIEEIHEKTNVYNFELDKDNTYFAENYLVHHYCELCSGYSNII
jgi:hypothetical protein